MISEHHRDEIPTRKRRNASTLAMRIAGCPLHWSLEEIKENMLTRTLSHDGNAMSQTMVIARGASRDLSRRHVSQCSLRPRAVMATSCLLLMPASPIRPIKKGFKHFLSRPNDISNKTTHFVER